MRRVGVVDGIRSHFFPLTSAQERGLESKPAGESGHAGRAADRPPGAPYATRASTALESIVTSGSGPEPLESHTDSGEGVSVGAATSPEESVQCRVPEQGRLQQHRSEGDDEQLTQSEQGDDEELERLIAQMMVSEAPNPPSQQQGALPHAAHGAPDDSRGQIPHQSPPTLLAQKPVSRQGAVVGGVEPLLCSLTKVCT